MGKSEFVYVTYVRTTPEELWDALTQPEITQAYWFGARLESEWKKGSPWKMVFPDGKVTDAGHIMEVERPKRLVLQWHHELMPEFKAEGDSRCVIDIEPAADAVKLAVRHEIDLPDSKLIGAVASGWPKILASLKSLLETGQALERTATEVKHAQAATAPERVLRVEVTVNAPVEAVWKVWSAAEGVQTFLAQKANIEFKIGGPYEIYFNPADERMSTKGCKLLSYAPREMISFQWILPGDLFPQLRKTPTWVVVQMRPAGAGRTAVTISQLGWGHTPEWDRAYAHMEKGWQMAAAMLQQRFDRGPIDWAAQRMMWQSARAETAAIDSTLEETKSP